MKLQIFNWVIEIHSQKSWQKAAQVSRLDGVKAYRELYPDKPLKHVVREVDKYIERIKR